MIHSRTSRLGLARASLLGVIGIVSSNVRADVLSDNLDNATAGTEIATDLRWLTASFATGGSNDHLGSVTLLLANTASGEAALDLYTDGSVEPGSYIGTLTSPDDCSSTLAATTFTASGMTLDANSTYWIVLRADSGEFAWAWTADDTGDGAGFLHTWGVSEENGASWWSHDIYATQFSLTAGVPAATMTAAVSRKANSAGSGGVCDLPLVPGVQSELRQGGITELRLRFDVTPSGPGADPVTIEEATCAAPAYVAYSGVSTWSTSVAGNELVVTFTPGLDNARTYKITVGYEVTSIAGQYVEASGLIGDVNSDGSVSGTDRSLVVGAWTGGGFSCMADIDSNALVNATDRSLVVSAWTGTEHCAP